VVGKNAVVDLIEENLNQSYAE
jgi:hypothetical protein